MESSSGRTQAEEIEDIIKLFCNRHLNDELEKYSCSLLERVKKNRRLNIFRGQKETWASAVIYAIARLNFLFDSENEQYVSPELICSFSDSSKLSVFRKADQIINECKIFLGDKKYSGKEINSMFDFYKTKVGFIVAKTALENRLRNIEEIDREEAEYLRRAVDERKQQEEKKLRERLVLCAEKNNEVHRNQADLFG